MPDVVIWMISGSKRIAYHRIPAYELLYSDNKNGRGKNCGKLMSLCLKVSGGEDMGTVLSNYLMGRVLVTGGNG